MSDTEVVAEAAAADIEDWFATATPEEVRIPICMNRALLGEFDACVVEYESRKPATTGIKMMDDPQWDEQFVSLQHKIVELKEAIEADEKLHTYILRKGDYEEWRKIIRSHPPTEEQKEKYRGFAEYDDEAAAPEMVAFSCVHPKMTLDQAKKLRALLPEHVFNKLRDGAIQVNKTGGDLPLSVRATVDQLSSALKSTTPVLTGSPSASSKDMSSRKAKPNGRNTTAR